MDRGDRATGTPEIGIDIIRRACEEPIRQIVTNAGAATGTGTGYDATANVQPNAANAAGTGTAFAAGVSETMGAAICSAVNDWIREHWLDRDPRLRASIVVPAQAPPLAVEEMLRWGSPIAGFLRTATRDVDACGASLREGDQVLMVYAAANRDPSAFGEDAEEFRAARDASGHVAFGFGEHFCLGAVLARLEARVFLEEAVARFATIAPAGPVERLASGVIAGTLAAPLRLGA